MKTDYEKFISFLEKNKLWHDKATDGRGYIFIYFWTPGRDISREVGYEPDAAVVTFKPDGTFYDVR